MSARFAVYDERLSRFTLQLEDLDTRDRSLSWMRFAAFLLGLVALALGSWALPNLRLPLYLLAGASAAAFLFLVWIHQRLATRQRFARSMQRTNREALARINRSWSELPPADPPPSLERSHVARDLLLFGQGSLFQLLGPPGTYAGRELLSRWLVEPADVTTIRLRQEAVVEMAPVLDFRQELHLRASLAGRLDPSGFLAWAEGDSWLQKRSWLVWLSRALPALLFLSILAQLLGLTTFPFWGSVLIVSVVVSLGFGERIHGIFDRLASRQASLAAYEKPLAVANALPAQSELLTSLQRRLEGTDGPAERAMRRLSRLIDLAALHHSQMTYLLIQALTLWDFHVLYALESWQRRNGRSVRAWLETLGEVEAIAALAGLSYDNPSWTMPEVTPKAGDCLVASALAHPMIRETERVANDVSIGPRGTFLLVTGSNMSGKSTLLRAIGTNVVLAQAGGPACAASLRMPPLELATSIVIEDSLIDGVSFFMAELRQLRDIVGGADRLDGSGDVRLLYLLDEILRGTNVVERQIAARRVILHLLRSGAIGAVSTHDTGIAAAPELAEAVRAVHFRETINEPGAKQAMTFDYLLRPGLATTTNALKLLELVGLGE